jgi:hypothetical protein
MYTYRTLNLIIGALAVLVISSCSQSADLASQAPATPEFGPTTFELSGIERQALAIDDDSALTAEFGDPALGRPSFEAVPSFAALARLQGTPSVEDGKTASTYGSRCSKHRKYRCGTCTTTNKCLKITGICNVTSRFTKTADGCTKSADVTYSAQVNFDSADVTGIRSGIEVIFSRGGNEIGRAVTDDKGLATFTETAVPIGTHSVNVCVAEGQTGDCADKSCSTYNSGSSCMPTITVKFTKTTATATSSKDLSNVVLKFCDGKVQKFDGLSGRKGTFFGTGSFSGQAIAGVWVKSGCNASGDGPGYGKWFEYKDADCKQDCGCKSDDDLCLPCTSTATEGKFCSTIDVAVYTDNIAGSVTGTGYFTTCNPLRVGQRNGMNFRIAYDQGAAQGYLNYWDGGTKIVNGQVKWLLISGVHSWFGGDNWMVHVYDGGKSFNLDSFEIWINDPITCTCYHCGGFLTGCYVNVSWRFASKCP